MNYSFEESIERRETGKCYPIITSRTLVERPDFDFAQEPSFGVLREYEHVIRLTHRFRANDAQLERATENSKRMLANHLYGKIIEDLNTIAQAAFAQDYEAVLITASRLRDELRKTFD